MLVEHRAGRRVIIVAETDLPKIQDALMIARALVVASLSEEPDPKESAALISVRDVLNHFIQSTEPSA